MKWHIFEAIKNLFRRRGKKKQRTKAATTMSLNEDENEEPCMKRPSQVPPSKTRESIREGSLANSYAPVEFLFYGGARASYAEQPKLLRYSFVNDTFFSNSSNADDEEFAPNFIPTLQVN